MKTPSNDLWKLIHSLTVSEKGYFIKYSKRHVIGDENNYTRLFEAINEQKEKYDENEIKQIFKKEKFINQLTTAKNYLYNMILKSLQSYYDDKSTESQLASMKEHYKILFQKTLFDQSEKIFLKAKKVALDEERFSKLIDIHRDQRNFDYRKIAEPDFTKYVDESLQEELDVLDKQKNIAEYNALYLKVSSLFKKIGIVRTKEDITQFKKIIDHPLMKNEKSAKSIRAKNLFYIISYLYYYCTNNHEKAFDFSLKRLNLIENNIRKIAGGVKEYLYSLSDAIAMSYNLNKIELCLKLLRKQREMADKYSVSGEVPDHLDMYVKSYSFELNIFILSGYFQEGLQIVNEVIRWFKKYSGKLNRPEELKVIYSIAYLYFGVGDYSKTLEWLNKILNDKTEYRLDYKAFAKIMNLIVHYELENYDLLEYEIKSVKRFLTKKDKLYEYEDIVLSFIKKLPDISDAKEKTFHLEILRNQISKLIKDNYDKKALEYFDIITWLDSKIEKKNFAEIVKSKSKVKIKDLSLVVK